MIDWLKRSGAKVAFIGGTGLHVELDQVKTRPFTDIGGMASATTLSHKGYVEIGMFRGTPLIQVCGRIHGYEIGRVNAMLPIYHCLAQAGVEDVLISGAVGSMIETLAPGSLAQVHDHLFFGGGSPLMGIANAFVDLSNAYQMDWASGLPSVTYAWTHGPHLETPAEIRALFGLGGQVVGMSMAPEVILARYFGLRVHGLVAAINWAAGCGPVLSLEAMMEKAGEASKGLPNLLESLMLRA